MKRKALWILSLAVTLGLTGCGSSSSSQKTGKKEVTLILDYVPNTNHTGFYVAQEKGYFADAGLSVNIIEPGDNETSATLVAVGKGQFGVSYQEDVTYARTAEEPLPIRAIATIIQHNTSGFVSLKSADIKSPKDFEGKVYAGWQAPSEEAVIRAVMKKAGGDFEKLTMVGTDGSGFASFGKTVDLQWDFEGWAVIKGRMDGFDLNYLPLRDLDERLDYYTPLIITNETMIQEDPETIKAFLTAVKKGYEDAIANPQEAADILAKVIPDTDPAFIQASQEYLSKEYQSDAPSWGMMKDEVWNRYTDFMVEYGLIDHKVEAKEQYTNEFLPQ